MVSKTRMLSRMCRFTCHCPRWQGVLLAGIGATAILAVGCHPKDQNTEAPAVAQSPSPTDANPSNPMTSPPVTNPGTPVTTATNAPPDLRELNGALLDWIIQNQRHPANFEEFAASSGTQIPPPPPGKKYVLNSRGLISLVDR
jgi:hypothetical protein